MEKAKVYFSKSITPETVIRLYEALEVELPGKVAVKVHSGEVGNQNFIRPNFWKPMIDQVQGTIVECNTDRISEGDRLSYTVGGGELKNLTTGETLFVTPLPPMMVDIMACGGIINYFKQHGGF